MKLVRNPVTALVSIVLVFLLLAGCDDDGKNTVSGDTTPTVPRTTSTATATAPQAPPPGIVLDPNLKSSTGIPSPEDMSPLVQLQARTPYPVMVPTYLPSSGYRLERELIGSSGPSTNDPVGYYSYRYSDPANPNRILTFNQTRGNSRPQSGYYLTQVTLNGTQFDVYWHKSLEYLPAGDPVRTDSVGDAETFFVVWRGQFTDASGQPQELFYSVSTGSWTGHGWGDIQAMLKSIRPLAEVG